MLSKIFLSAVLMLSLAVGAHAQGGYPRTRRGTQRSSGIATPTSKDLAGTFHGTLKSISGKEIVVQISEEQTVTIRRSRKTKFYQDKKEIKVTDIPLDAVISVDATEDVDMKPIAVSVTLDPPVKDSK